MRCVTASSSLRNNSSKRRLFPPWGASMSFRGEFAFVVFVAFVSVVFVVVVVVDDDDDDDNGGGRRVQDGADCRCAKGDASSRTNFSTGLDDAAVDSRTRRTCAGASGANKAC